ncbi:putative NRPS-like protein biosynthetic cluster [Venturia inaequalis]|uniref:Putative NRPS-like protein biosynthetic cluster n=1 Tax=Venturia inaequalis TaxID=5025 RepID=A0A8H3Z609_VENIN|nr:putative NRPS-like protein biosynthetic cluster [Venturia inaequalis]
MSNPNDQVPPPSTQPIPTTPFNPSILHGPSTPPLVTLTLSKLLDIQCRRYGPKECLIIPWTGARWTYHKLREESINLAKMLVEVGIRPGDRVGVMAGNCEQYVAVVFAVARVGGILVVLNNTYTAGEALRGLRHTACKILFTTFKLGKADNSALLSKLSRDPNAAPWLEEIIILNGEAREYRTYAEAIETGSNLLEDEIEELDSHLGTYEVAMLLFTSGSTGNPKAASLTHHNVINNARFIGDRLALTHTDILCCPPPLFHCFGLVLGLLACMTHGASIVYPAEMFDPQETLLAIAREKCTALHGVPAMFDSVFSLPREGLDMTSLRTGIIAGAPVPRHLMEMMYDEFGMREFTSSYEASPTVFNAHTHDPVHLKLTTVGTLLPHAHAKIVDKHNRIVPVGTRGELCIAGYQLQAGYWQNASKTSESMILDDEGILWLHTGDEAVFDNNGYCSITGRFKDLIIRGGENIYPLEIEERLVEHPSIERAVVVGVKHARFGEVVGAFLQRKEGVERPSDEEIRKWTAQTLGRHKCPAHVFWFGEDGVLGEVPLTGSGKVQKFVLRDVAEQWLYGGGGAAVARL